MIHMLEAIEHLVDDHARDRHLEPHRKRPSGVPPTPPAALLATTCAPTRCRSRSSVSAPSFLGFFAGRLGAWASEWPYGPIRQMGQKLVAMGQVPGEVRR